jgi:hypothetical protein
MKTKLANPPGGEYDPRKTWRDLHKDILDDLYREAAENDLPLLPDTAFLRLFDELERWFPSSVGQTQKSTATPRLRPRMGLIAGLREAHHYSVDAFYRTYFPQKGAPRITDGNKLLDLVERGLSYRQIAQATGLTKDAARKRIVRTRKRRAQ